LAQPLLKEIRNNGINRPYKYMKNTMKLIVAAVLMIAAAAQAAPIVGSIGFGSGVYTQVGGSPGDLGSATSFTLGTPTITAGATTGAFTGATLNTFSTSIGVNGNAPALVGQQLWKVTVGATVYTFTVSTAVETLSADHTALDLTGRGTIADGTPADNTLGTYTLHFGASGAAFTFGATSANAVPDGGMTVILLGAALSGLGLARKKLIA
jgi:hypothetical protein